MKKIMLIAFAFSLLSTSAFAQQTFTSTANTAVTGVLTGFKASKQVVVACTAAAQTYAATSDHMNGTRAFGVSSGDPLIYFREKTDTEVGTNVAAGDNTASDSSNFAGWSSL